MLAVGENWGDKWLKVRRVGSGVISRSYSTPDGHKSIVSPYQFLDGLHPPMQYPVEFGIFLL